MTLPFEAIMHCKVGTSLGVFGIFSHLRSPILYVCIERFSADPVADWVALWLLLPSFLEMHISLIKESFKKN